MSEGTLNNVVRKCYDVLEPFENRAKELLISAPVEHFDETGMRYEKKLIWVHTACTSNITLLFPHRRRGGEAMDAFGILPNFQGIAVHDYMKSYYKYACLHALCCAHILRELVFQCEVEKRKWAQEFIVLLRGMHERVEKAKKSGATSRLSER